MRMPSMFWRWATVAASSFAKHCCLAVFGSGRANGPDAGASGEWYAGNEAGGVRPGRGWAEDDDDDARAVSFGSKAVEVDSDAAAVCSSALRIFSWTSCEYRDSVAAGLQGGAENADAAGATVPATVVIVCEETTMVEVEDESFALGG